MDPTETLRFDFEPAGSSRRRISSILKAPRPSTRLSDSDQKEVQAENVRPTEKRRNSRRVSFASKNDIRLFANNERGAPPVRSPLQDVFTSGTDPESTKGIYIHEDGTQPVSGMDDLLMAPLHVSQLNNKVRFFTDPTVQGDQTKVFDAEEDAYMDMTHCHTIVIDKDSNLNLDCGTEMTSSGLSKNETTQDKSIFHTQVERDTDFLAFLAGFSQKDNSKKCDVAPKNVDYVTGTDKENLPPVLSSRRSDRPGTSQSQGLHLKRRSTGHPEQQLIERTKIHTEGGGPRHGHYDVPGQGLHWISASQQSTLPNNEDDMELTRNQTVAIKFKTTDVDNRAETLRLDPNNTKIFSADECGMELTGVVSGSFGIQGQVETQFSKTACASTHELGNQHWGGGFPSVANALCLPDSDSTQIPCISTVNIKSKGFDQVEPFGEVRRSMLSNQTVVDCEGMNLTKALHGHIEVTHMGRDETNKTLIFSKDDCDGMELTQGQNVVINFKCSEKEQYVHKPRKSLSFHQTVDFMQDEAMELTEAVTACIEAKRNDTVLHSNQSVCMDLPLNQAAFSNSKDYIASGSSGSDDMELTRSQTVVTDSKHMVGYSLQPARSICNFDKTIVFSDKDNGMEMSQCQTVAVHTEEQKLTVNEPRKSLHFHRGVEFMQDGEAMELTEAITGCIEANNYSSGNKGGSLLPSNQSIYMNSISSQTVASDSRVHGYLDPDDMELTRSQTVVTDSKNVGLVPHSLKMSINKPRKSLSFHRGVDFLQDGLTMELTEAISGCIEANGHSNQTGFTEVKPIPDAMEMTRNQMVIIALKHTELVNDFSLNAAKDVGGNQELNKTRFSNDDPSGTGLASYNSDNCTDDCPGMEMTGVIGGNIETDSMFIPSNANTCMDLTLNQIVSNVWPASGSVPDDDMEITRSQDTNRTLIFPTKDNEMQMTGTHGKKKVLCGYEEPFFRSVNDKERSTGCSSLSDFNDTEMTKSQTVLTESHQARKSSPNISSSSSNQLNDGRKEVERSNVDCPKMMEGLEMNRTITGNVGMDTVECKIQTCTRTEVETGLIGTPEPDVCSSPVSSVTRDFEDQQRVAMSSISIQDHRVLESWKSANAVTCDLDEMEFTRSKTVVIDSVGVERTNEPAPVDPQDHYTEFLCQESVLPEGNTHVADSADSVVMYGDNRSEEPIKSRRKSLADLQSKLQSILQCMNHSNEEVVGSVTAPLPQLRERLTETEGLKELRTTATSDELRNNSLSEGSERKTMGSWQNKALTARISVGGFLPKLPSRPKPTDPDPVMSKIAAAVQNDYTTCEPNGSFETVDDLNDIELPEMSANEDVSETLDRNCLNKTMDIETPSEVPVQDDEDSATSQGLKRPFPEDHQETEDSQRKRPQSESPIQEMVPSSPNVLWDSKGPAGSVKTMDGTNSSSNSTNIKCEATFESMYKSAEMQGDSQMDYETMDSEFDFHKKVEDGSITVNEFLRHFGIDFVIHRSRPSALPEKFVPDDKQSIEHHLRELHIYRPKQRVYDAECEKLTELVEGLKPRMLEQDSLLRNVNKSLLQEMLVLSKEQLQIFGSKLKERKGYFRKRSKARSHEMKVGMYSELVHTVQEAEESLREKITKADKWLEELDACAHGLEMEISAIDSAVTDSFDLPPILETRQKELDTLDVALEKKQRHLTQLGCEKMALGEKLVILQKKTREMENHIHLLDSVNEWKLSQKCNSGALFSFLYNSIQLEVTFQQSKGEHGLSNQSEQDLLDISFHFLLDADKSECHANMLHKLIYQYTQSKKNWTEEYQTTRDIPMLLHDVSLVVSRCRLLGEEIHRLKKWGALRLGILEISCSDTMVSVLFSSLKAFVKFQITLDIPSSYPFGCLKIQHLHNYIGETRMDQVAASVSSVTPAKNYLTKVLKIIHDDLLA